MKRILKATFIAAPLLLSSIESGYCSLAKEENWLLETTKKRALVNVSWFLYHDLPESFLKSTVILSTKQRKAQTLFIETNRLFHGNLRNTLRQRLKVLIKESGENIKADMWISENIFLFTSDPPNIKEGIDDWLEYWTPTFSEIRREIQNSIKGISF